MLSTITTVIQNMTDYLDPSPRSSKRRRTTYKTTRSILGGEEDGNPPSTTKTRRSTDQPVEVLPEQGDYIDSAYGSKEDSLLEDDDSLDAANEAGTTPSAKESAREKRGKRATGLQIAVTDTKKSNRSKIKKDGVNVDSTQDQPARDATPVVVESEDELAQDTIAVQPRSSTRERKRPRRFSISPEKPKSKKQLLIKETSQVEQDLRLEQSPQKRTVESPLKGILTPSRKGKRTGPRKSVVFDQDEEAIGQQFGFKDIETPADESEKSLGSKSPSKKRDRQQRKETGEPDTPTKSTQRKNSSGPVTKLVLDLQVDDILEEPWIDDFQVKPLETVPDRFAATHVNIEEEPAVLAAKCAILSRLVSTGTKDIPPHLQSQYDALHSLLRATVTAGESNSLLLLGGRGTGKSHLLKAAISALRTEYSDEFYTVHLNGFFQTDDKLALREIWRQLGREMQVDEMENGELGGSYADTMASLLSLLSHPDEFMDPAIDGGEDAMQVDSSATRTSKSIIFVLDEFDLFTTHPRQTLLYNLFDIAQSRKAPIAVIGCSTRMDVVECLEKRVKSRFSHRWLHIPTIKTLSSFQDAVSKVLCFEEDNTLATFKVSKEEMETRKRWNEHIRSFFLPLSDTQDLIQRVYQTTRSLPELFAALYIPIATLQLSTEVASNTLQLCSTVSDLPANLSLLCDLPTLHLSLLIAATRLDTIHNLATVNFNLVYAHYAELISRSKLQITASGAVAVGASLRQWSRDSARSAWEDLGSYDLMVPATGSGVGSGSGNRDGAANMGDSIGGEGASVRMWRADVTLEEVAWAVKQKWRESGGARDVLAKWCREI